MRHPLVLLILPLAILTLARGGFAVGQQAAPKKAGNYTVTKKTVEGHVTYHLHDAARKMEVGIVPDIGNFAYEFKANGKDVLIAPESFQAYLEKRWFGWGIPFLAPYANRIDQEYYYFQGKRYLLNDTLGNILRVPPNNYALHGLLVFDPRWEVVKSGGSAAGGLSPRGWSSTSIPT
jgi:aldose 1-epimerase